MPNFLNSNQVAEILQVSSMTARKIMARAGAINVGQGTQNKTMRITEEALYAYLETQRVHSPDPMPFVRQLYSTKGKAGRVLTEAEMYPGLQRRKA